jgi:hypothetical protein
LSKTKVRILAAVSLGLLLALHAPTLHAQATPRSTSSASPFDQNKIALHLQLLTDGGAIDLVVKDSSTNAMRETARHISDNLAAGNFDLQLFPEPAPPPNLIALKKQKAAFAYKTEEIANGLRIHITASDLVARAALHDFLRFEIAANKTCDAVAEPNSPKHDHAGIKDLGRDAPPGPDVRRPPPD